MTDLDLVLCSKPGAPCRMLVRRDIAVETVQNKCDNDNCRISLLVYRTHPVIHSYYGSTGVDGAGTSQVCGDLGIVECSIAILVCASSEAALQLLLEDMYAVMKRHIVSLNKTFLPDLPSAVLRETMPYGVYRTMAETAVMAAVHTWDLGNVGVVIQTAASHIAETFFPGALDLDSKRETEANLLREYMYRRICGCARTIRTVVALGAVFPSIAWDRAPEDLRMDIDQLWALCSHGSHSFGLPACNPFLFCTAAILRQICRENCIIHHLMSNPGDPSYSEQSFYDRAWETGWGNGIGASVRLIVATAYATNGFKGAQLKEFTRPTFRIKDANPFYNWLLNSRHAGASAITAFTISSEFFRDMCFKPITIEMCGLTVTLSSIFDVFCKNFEALYMKHVARDQSSGSIAIFRDLRDSLLPASMVVWYHLATALGGLSAWVDCDQINPNHVRFFCSNNEQMRRLQCAFMHSAKSTLVTVYGCVAKVGSALPSLPDEIWDRILDRTMRHVDVMGSAPYSTPQHDDIVRYCMDHSLAKACSDSFSCCMRANIQLCLQMYTSNCMQTDRFASLWGGLDVCCAKDPVRSHEWLTNTCRRTRPGCRPPTLGEISREEGLLPEVASRCRTILCSHLRQRDQYVAKKQHSFFAEMDAS